MMETNKTILILGGMGSRASTKFLSIAYDLLVDVDDHMLPRIILDNSTDIPSRGLYFLGRGEDPTPIMLERLRTYKKNYNLEAIYIPCNTVHLLKNRLAEFKSLWVDLPNTVIRYIKAAGHKKVLLVGSKATLASNLYKSDKNLSIIHASKEINEIFEAEIYQRKMGLTINEKQNISVLDTLKEEFDAILLACTELEVFEYSIPIISSTNVYAAELASHILKLRSK
jgi:aspartate/glutamate racemase